MGNQCNRDNGVGAPDKQSSGDVPITSNNSLEDEEIEHADVKNIERHNDMNIDIAGVEKEVTRWGDEVENGVERDVMGRLSDEWNQNLETQTQYN